jgi:hypothetical protein
LKKKVKILDPVQYCNINTAQYFWRVNPALESELEIEEMVNIVSSKLEEIHENASDENEGLMIAINYCRNGRKKFAPRHRV